MNRSLWTLAVLCAGCGGNPYDTGSDQQTLREREEKLVQPQMSRDEKRPASKEVAFRSPELEGWRTTVLENADAAMLDRMRGESLQRIALLDWRWRELSSSVPRVTQSQRDKLQYDLAFERTRLKMIEDRQAVVSGR